MTHISGTKLWKWFSVLPRQGRLLISYFFLSPKKFIFYQNNTNPYPNTNPNPHTVFQNILLSLFPSHTPAKGFDIHT